MTPHGDRVLAPATKSPTPSTACPARDEAAAARAHTVTPHGDPRARGVVNKFRVALSDPANHNAVQIQTHSSCVDPVVDKVVTAVRPALKAEQTTWGWRSPELASASWGSFPDPNCTWQTTRKSRGAASPKGPETRPTLHGADHS